jgi:hypothetical protein
VNEPPKTHYLNADFDLGLRPRPRQLERPAMLRQVRELSVQALLAADARDNVLIRAGIPPGYLDYLEQCGIPPPRLLDHPQIDADALFRPLGWSSEAIELNRAHHRTTSHPPLSVVRRVNSRSYARRLEADAIPGGPLGTVIEAREELKTFLDGAPPSGAWVIKSEHGNAGLANRRLRRSGLSPADWRFVDERLAEDDRLVVEPWLSRERDWCGVFAVPFEAASFRVHETVYTSDGALIGALFDPDAAAAAPWVEELASSAERIAARLHAEGYFGPVCVDSFTWLDGERVRLRALVDLNCRRAMSDGAYRMWRRLAPERTLFYRFFNRRKLGLPGSLKQFVNELETHRYDRSTRRGILVASPLELDLDGEQVQPGKLALILVGATRQEVFIMERWFRERFEG